MLEVKIEPGTLINNRYQIQRVLGQGGFGRTYLAYDTERFGELCVLKEFVPSNRTEYVVQKSRELFEREARVLYQLDHPQIPKFLAWFVYAEDLFLVQEYIEGKTYASLLKERQQRSQKFAEAEVTQWLKDLLSVLTYLHGRNIFHRDISPDNIMLPFGQSQPVLIDFGLVKQTVSQIWTTNPDSINDIGQHSFVGKFGYAPPEQIRMGQCYPCSDLYALAVTAIVLLTGKEPSWLIDHASLEWQWRSYVDVSDHLAQTLDKMLAEKPKERYQLAEEVLAALQPMAMNQMLLDLQLEIDEERKNRQVAEIEETDYFQQLKEQAEQLRDSFDSNPQTQLAEGEEEIDYFQQLQEQAEQFRDSFDSNPQTQLEEEFPVLSTWPEKTTRNRNESSGAVDSRTQPEAVIRPKLNPAFLDRCQKELTRCIGPMASYVLGEILAKHPTLSPEQLVEALVTEIPNSQKAQEFRKNVKTDAETQPQPATPPKLTPAFLDRCQKELTRCIGPMASYVLGEILAKHPALSPEQLVEALVTEIPNSQKAQEFRKNVKTDAEIQPQSATLPKLTPAFLDRCQKEFARCVGPMAGYILDETLAEYPDISLQQLVEALAAEIPNPQKAFEFRQHLLL